MWKESVLKNLVHNDALFVHVFVYGTEFTSVTNDSSKTKVLNTILKYNLVSLTNLKYLY